MQDQPPKTPGLVVTSNELIRAKYHFTLWQKRVFMYCVAQIEKDAREFGMQKVVISKLLDFFKTEQNGTVADIIENVPRQLYETSIQVPYRDASGFDRFSEVRLITKYTRPQDREPGNAYIELKFNEDLRPHLLDLKKQFSKYELENIIHLQSAHSIRVFEILKSHQYQKQIELEVESLKVILEVDAKYRLYGDFKRKILDKAQADLLQHCDIRFDYKEIKSGKKVVALRFSIFENAPNRAGERPEKMASKSRKPTAPTAFSAPENDADRDALFLEIQPMVVIEWGVSPSKLIDLIRANDPERIRRAVRVTQRQAEKGVLKNRAGFFIEAVSKAWSDENEAATARKTQSAAIEKAQTEKVEAARTALDAKLDAMRGEINAVIRSLVEADAEVRSSAIEAIRAARNPIWRREMDKAGDELADDHFRKNPTLREAVIWEIVRQQAAHFEAIKTRFSAEIALFYQNLRLLNGGKAEHFEGKAFLGLR